jgi:hypothetical protein
MTSSRPSQKAPQPRRPTEEEKRRRQEELGIVLPAPLKPWESVDTVSKQVVPHFEKGEHPLMVAKKLGLNKNTVRSYWHRWRKELGI